MILVIFQFNPYTMKHYFLIFLSLVAGQVFGQSDAEIEKERSRWNNALTQDTTKFSREPNALLVSTIEFLKPGKALDIGMGQGRNSIFLATKGWDVTGVDVADKAVALAQKNAAEKNVKINAVVMPIEKFGYGKNEWDLITHIYEGCPTPDRIEKIKEGLKTGGVLVFEFFHREGGIEMKRPGFGCETNSVRNVMQKVGGFTLSRYEETMAIADFSLKRLKVVKMVAKKN